MNEELLNILEKVKQLYLKYGIKSITMDDVARELGISKKTLYQYFENKTDLVTRVLDYEMRNRKCEMDKLHAKKMNAIEELLLVSQHIIQQMKEVNPSANYDLKKYYPDLYHKIHTLQREKMYEAILQNIQKGKKEGLYRQEVDEAIIAKLQVLLFENFSESDIFPNEELSNPNFLKESFIYHIHGIANKKGLDFLHQKLREEENLNSITEK